MKINHIICSLGLMASSLAYSCPEGLSETEKSHPFSVTTDESGNYVITIDNEGDDNLLGLFVTDQDAVLPKGPWGTLDGTNYWSLEVQSFPKTFGMPITYGEVPEKAQDNSEKHKGIRGGTPLQDIPSGTCLKFTTVHYPSFSNTAFYVLHD